MPDLPSGLTPPPRGWLGVPPCGVLHDDNDDDADMTPQGVPNLSRSKQSKALISDNAVPNFPGAGVGTAMKSRTHESPKVHTGKKVPACGYL